ncbi:MAG: ion transporter [Pseudomonadota bacterium]|nr:ion transporter [Pseudomonadota bacterium]
MRGRISAAAGSPAIAATSLESERFGKPAAGWRRTWFTVIFESETRGGRTFDLILLTVIAASVFVVMVDSVSGFAARHGAALDALEWIFTIVFTAEYLARLTSVQRPLRYATSFFGIVDLLSVLPAYLALFVPELHSLVDVRLLRLLRAFRILKLTEYISEIGALREALRLSRRKIFVFICTVLIIDVLMGTLMYVVEGPQNGFNNIPVSIYWAITTMTTVGFGDLVPKTDLGRAIASCMMLLGWGILAVPTGIVSAEMTHRRFGALLGGDRPCPGCGAIGHGAAAKFCMNCGATLVVSAQPAPLQAATKSG